MLDLLSRVAIDSESPSVVVESKEDRLPSLVLPSASSEGKGGSGGRSAFEFPFVRPKTGASELTLLLLDTGSLGPIRFPLNDGEDVTEGNPDIDPRRGVPGSRGPPGPRGRGPPSLSDIDRRCCSDLMLPLSCSPSSSMS